MAEVLSINRDYSKRVVKENNGMEVKWQVTKFRMSLKTCQI